MFYEESKVWRYVPKAQMWKDFEERHPAPATEGRLMIDCYEYRMPSGSRLILAADLPVALLIGTSANGCGLGAVRLVPSKLMYHVRVKASVILVEALIVLGIFVQWLLVGSWLDKRNEQSKPTRRWVVLIAVITVGGFVMALTAFGQRGEAELVNIYSAMITLLAWIVLIVMFVAGWVASVIRKIRHPAPQ
jgi:hypothetical protein